MHYGMKLACEKMLPPPHAPMAGRCTSMRLPLTLPQPQPQPTHSCGGPPRWPSAWWRPRPRPPGRPPGRWSHLEGEGKRREGGDVLVVDGHRLRVA